MGPGPVEGRPPGQVEAGAVGGQAPVAGTLAGRSIPGPLWAGGTPSAENWYLEAKELLRAAGLLKINGWLDRLAGLASTNDTLLTCAVNTLTLLRDRRYDAGAVKRSALLAAVNHALSRILRSVPKLDAGAQAPIGTWTSRPDGPCAPLRLAKARS